MSRRLIPLLLIVVWTGVSRAAEKGEVLTVTFRTTDTGGHFKPANCNAVWVENSRGQFVRTVGRWGKVFHKFCLSWKKKVRNIKDLDGFSGATVKNHKKSLKATWDMKDKQGNVVPDGTYVIRIEMADRNSKRPSVNHQARFTFEKNGKAFKSKTKARGFPEVVIEYSGRQEKKPAPKTPEVSKPGPKIPEKKPGPKTPEKKPEPRPVTLPMTPERKRRLKLSFAKNFELNDMTDKALEIYKLVIEKYPDTPEAKIAGERIKKIKDAAAE